MGEKQNAKHTLFKISICSTFQTTHQGNTTDVMFFYLTINHIKVETSDLYDQAIPQKTI